jgi:hypothetical protein
MLREEAPSSRLLNISAFVRRHRKNRISKWLLSGSFGFRHSRSLQSGRERFSATENKTTNLREVASHERQWPKNGRDCLSWGFHFIGNCRYLALSFTTCIDK